MKLALLAVCVEAFLVAPGIAAADTAQGKLTGSASTFPGFRLRIHPQDPVIDGGTSYIGKENDNPATATGTAEPS